MENPTGLRQFNHTPLSRLSPNSVFLSLKKAKMRFWQGTRPRLRKLGGDQRGLVVSYQITLVVELPPLAGGVFGYLHYSGPWFWFAHTPHHLSILGLNPPPPFLIAVHPSGSKLRSRSIRIEISAFRKRPTKPNSIIAS